MQTDNEFGHIVQPTCVYLKNLISEIIRFKIDT